MARAVLADPLPLETFDLTGKFLGFACVDDYKLKYLRLETPQGQYLIKIPKPERLNLYKTLQVGMMIHCQGDRKPDKNNRYWRYKANSIRVITPDCIPSEKAAPIKVLICGKGDCVAAGSQTIASIFQQNPNFQVQITGCQKQCKQAPNLLISAPHYKQRHSRLRADQVPQIMQTVLDSLS